MNISVGTENKAKLAAVEKALNELDFSPFKLVGLSVPSQVADQPFGDEETMQGAINRAITVQEQSGAAIGLGLEGGVVETPHGLFVCNWGALWDSSLQQPIVAGGARIPLPEEVSSKLLAGEELGPVMEEFSQRKDIRQGKGAVGVFTNDRLHRSEMFAHIVKLLIGQWEYQRRNYENSPSW